MTPHAPALYPATVVHARTEGLRHGFGYRTFLWFVDLDDLPRWRWPLGALARFRARDHVGNPERTIRQNIDALARTHGIELGGGRVYLLAAAAVLGHVFNPLSLYWCFDRTGDLACVVAEVHNTYGERHCYLVQPGADDRAAVDKALYVSPFFGVDGRYELSVPVPGERLRISVRLLRPGPDAGERVAFGAVLTGEHRPGTARALVRLLLRHPFPTHLVSLRIRIQGVGLWLRGLRVQERPRHEEVSSS